VNDEAGSDHRVEQRTSATLGDLAARRDVLDRSRSPLEKVEDSMRHSRRQRAGQPMRIDRVQRKFDGGSVNLRHKS
jgi:hypothetical protein